MLLGFAQAADGTASGGVAPELNAQAFRPSTDSSTFFRLTDSTVGPKGILGWRATTSWSKDPLVWADYFGTEESIVSNLVQTDLAASYAFGKARLAIDVPVVWRSFGGTAADTTGIGDITVDGKYRILDGGIGLAASARAFLPTSTLGAPLGGPFGGELEVVADKEFNDKLLAALSVGTTLRGGQDMENVGWGSQLHVGVGAGYALSDTFGLVAELDVNPVLESLGLPEGRPFEALVGANIGAGKLLVRPAVAFGLGDAVGTPAWRAILAISNVPQPPPPDADGDGLLDAQDACPKEPEDIDTWMDTDGCPEPTDVTVKLIDSDGQPVPDGAWTAGTLSGKTGEAAKFAPGPVEFVVGTTKQAATIANGPPTEVVVTVPAPRGTLVVNIVDKAGNPVPNAAWSAAGPTDLKGQPAGSYQLRPGNYVVSASAPGFKKSLNNTVIQKDGSLTITLEMEPSKAELAGEKIEIKDSVYYETSKAIIKPESFALLDEVAEILKEHPELTKIRIEGHTDSRGDNAANKKLSQERATSVMKYLTEKGIAADRLEAIGYGEEKPLVKEKTDADRAKNRRVDFAVVGRSDAAKPGEVKQVETQGDKPKDK